MNIKAQPYGARFSLTAAALLLVLGPGCLFLSPSDEEAGPSLRIVAHASAPDPAKAPCPDVDAMLADTDGLSARATILRRLNNFAVPQVVGGGALAVEAGAAPNSLVLLGDVDFELGPVNSEYFILVELSYQGRELAGEYAGRLVLESGITVDVDVLSIGPLADIGGGRLATDAVEFCVSSDAVQEAGDDPFCVGVDGLENSGVIYQPGLNRLSFSYERTGVKLEGEDELRTVFVELIGGLAPAPFYSTPNAVALPPIIPGSKKPIEVELELQAIPGAGPGSTEEVLNGKIGLRFVDGRPPEETGGFVLKRTQALVCPATVE